jgi:phage terminase large subunit
MEVERREVIIDYAPRKQFQGFHDRTERWAILVAHRRAGKTVACINDLIARAIQTEKPEGRYAYVAPLFNQAKDIAWSYLKKYAQPLLAAPPNESELRVDLLNGARIRLYGADNPDRLRGLYLDGVVLDEYADMRPSVWGEIIRPMLTDRAGWAVFIGTPKGKNAFWDVWNNAGKDKAWFSVMLKASETGIIPEGELQAAAADMGRDQYRQEFECSFEAAIKGAFYAEELDRAERDNRICGIPIDRAVPVHTAWDLGVTDSTAIWFVQVVGRERRFIDYEEASGVGFDYYAKLLKDKGYIYGDHYFPHDVQAREMSSGRTRVETLEGLGISPEIVPVRDVMDGINATRRLIDQSWFDKDRCERGLEALKQYRREWDDKLKDWKMRPLHDWSSHGADALRTFASGFEDKHPMKKVYVPRFAGQGNWMGA